MICGSEPFTSSSEFVTLKIYDVLGGNIPFTGFFIISLKIVAINKYLLQIPRNNTSLLR